jgi:predicted HicB family RNase H-like nuclease
MKSDMMKYKGYRATIGYDRVDKIFVGHVFGIKDSLNFY